MNGGVESANSSEMSLSIVTTMGNLSRSVSAQTTIPFIPNERAHSFCVNDLACPLIDFIFATQR